MANMLKENQEVVEEFGFIREKIKDEPLNRKKILMKLGWNVILAIVFGLVACATFLVVKPYLARYLIPTDSPAIDIPEDEQEAVNEQDSDTENAEENDTEDKTTTKNVYITNTQPLEVTDYENLQSEIYGIGIEGNKSIVNVTGQTSDIDLFNDTYKNERKTSGVIINDNGSELLILTDRSTIDGVDSIVVTFVNDESVSAQLKKYDSVTGIAILSVSLDSISEETKQAYKTAVLGNSYVTRQGTTVLALGDFCGYNHAIAQGTITASTGVISMSDQDITVLATNIPGKGQGSGVLINLSGEVIGVILKEFSSEGGAIVTALSISELKDTIERLSNSSDIPYLGIKGTTVSAEDVKQYGLSEGVFVSRVNIDSPAMISGIQNGDVIVKFNDKEILNTTDYENALSKCSVGSEVEITVMRQGVEEYTEIECNPVVSVLQ